MNPIQSHNQMIRIAVVQIQAHLGDLQGNLARAMPFIEQAARQGAQLVALPELAACGYSMSDAIWDWGETAIGPTVQWLKETASRLGIYLGTGFLEVEELDFYNSYAIATPEGAIAGIVRKTMAETACFRCSDGPHVVETAIARIGVGICADNLFAPNLRKMQDGGADLLLMPHAAPIPYRTGGLVSEKDIPEARESLGQMAPRYTRLIGIPVAFINQVGPRGLENWVGLFGRLMNAQQFKLGGLSTIADSAGTVCAQMDDNAEGVLIADMMLDPARKIAARPVGYGRYGGGFVTPHPFLFEAICTVDAFFGRRHYQASRLREVKARNLKSA